MRSVGVKLMAEVASYKANMKGAGQTTKEFGRDVDRTAKKASADLDEITRHAKRLEDQLGDTDQAIKSLARSFAETGDTTILKQIGEQQAQLAKLKNVRSLLPSPEDLKRRGRDSGQGFLTGLSSSLSKSSGMTPMVIQALAAAGVVASPLIGASIAAAVIGGAGVGGVLGGVVLASKDPTVAKAGADLGDVITRDLKNRSANFVEPTLKGIARIGKGYQSLGPDIDRIFGNSAKFIDPLADGAVRGTAAVVEGIADAVEKAGPVIDQLGVSFQQIGGAVGGVFTTLADDADEGASALGRLTDATVTVIDATGDTIGVLADVYGWYDKIDLKAQELTGNSLIDMLPGPGQLSFLWEDVADGNHKIMHSARDAADGMFTAADAARSQRDALSALADQQRAQTDPVFALMKAQDDLAEAQAKHDAALDKHGNETTKSREQLRKMATAAIDVQAAVGALGTEFDGKLTPSLRATLKAAGFTKTEIKALETQFANAKAAGEKFAKTYNAEAIFTIKIKGQLPRTGGFGINGGDFSGVGGLARGGIVTPMADGGIGQIYPASNPPLYRYAEPETGGEAFIPKNGNRRRGQQLVSEVASWYGMAATPMAAGGITRAAATGLVGSPTGLSGRGTRLDSDNAHLSARDSVAALNASLKDNGRSLSFATAKGRENRAELNSAIQAAQSAAQAKFAETGSVHAANAAYDAHIARLKATLRQQGVNATTIKSLMGSLAERPGYDGAGSNSMATIAFVKDKMALSDATSDAQNFFTWGKPTFNSNSTTGRDELGALFEFLEQANQAAQSRFAQTGSTKAATSLYNTSISQLRGILAKAGMKKSAVNSLLQTYGRITLGNQAGGVYEHAQTGLLRDAHLAPGGPTRYAYAEPATGGEAFIPKNGNQDRSRAIWQYVGQNWLGQQPTWQTNRGAVTTAAGASGSLTVRVVVQDGQVAGLIDVVVDEALGALADAHVYQTAD